MDEPTPGLETNNLTAMGALEQGLLAELEAEDDAPGIATEQPRDDAEPSADDEQLATEERDEESNADATEDEPTAEDADAAHDDIALPPGMAEADRSKFAQLTTDMQSWVTQRMTDQDRFLTQRSQELADNRRELQQQFGTLMQRMQAYDDQLAQFTQLPELPARELMDEDPMAYQEQMHAYWQAQHHAQQAQEERQRVQAEQERLQTQNLQRMQAYEAQQLKRLLPDVASNPEERRALVDYGRAQGFEDTMLAHATAAEWVILNKARQYDAAQAAGQKAKEAQSARKVAPKAARPGPARGVGNRRGDAVMKALREKPTTRTLEAAFLAELEAEG